MEAESAIEIARFEREEAIEIKKYRDTKKAGEILFKKRVQEKEDAIVFQFKQKEFAGKKKFIEAEGMERYNSKFEEP